MNLYNASNMINGEEKPLVSIITVCLNSGKTIRKTIESVLNQTYTNFEYIIKDGGSTDNTLDIIHEYKDKFSGRLKLIKKKDKCMYDAMNQGIEASSGKIIGIINSDDYYSNRTLEKVVEIYNNIKTQLIVIIGDMERVSKSGETIYKYHYTNSLLQKKACFGHPSMFAAKAVYDRIGLYDISYSLAADGDWQYRALEDEKIKFVLCPYIFNHMREGGASDNPKYRWKWFKERSRMQIEHKRGSKFGIYCSEFKKVLVTDIKAFLPRKIMSKAYKIRYRNHCD